jgi:hypothetical protein
VSQPDFRALGRRGGLTTASRHDMRATAARARKRSPGQLDYWRERVDPDGALPASDREQRAHAARRIYFSDLARKRVTPNATDGRPTDRTAAVKSDSGDIASRVSRAG